MLDRRIKGHKYQKGVKGLCVKTHIKYNNQPIPKLVFYRMSTQKVSKCTSVNLDNSLKALEDTIDYYYNTFTMADQMDITPTGLVSGKVEYLTIDSKKNTCLSSTPVLVKELLSDRDPPKVATPKQRTLHDLFKLPECLGRTSDSTSQQKKRKVISPIQPLLQDTSDDESQDEHAKINTEFVSRGIIDEMQKSFNAAVNQVSETLSKTLVSQFESITEELREIKSTLESRDQEINTISRELKDCQNRNRLDEGRICRAEKEIRDLKSELSHLKARSMMNNLVFYNISESTEPEIPETLMKTFFNHEMKIPLGEVNNLTIENIHRLGQKGKKSRPMVVKFGLFSDKEKVLRHAKNLDKSKHFRVDTQLPPELRAKKQQLLPKFHEAKRNHKQVRWNLDKLIIDNQEVVADHDKIWDVKHEPKGATGSTKWRHVPPKQYLQSTFQGHSTDVSSCSQIVPSLHALYRDIRCASATHNIYAYRIRTDEGITEYYDDDGEWGGGRVILNAMKENNCENKLICVTRWYGGRHLGSKRFDNIREAANLAISM